MRRVSRLLIGVLLLAPISCATSSTRPYQVTLNAYHRQAESAQSANRVHLVPNPQNPNPLLDEEVRAKLAGALQARGYSVVGFEDADLYILADVGIGMPREVATVARVWTPDQTTTVKDALGREVGSLSTPGTASAVRSSAQVFDRWLNIVAIDGGAFRATKEVRVAWQGEARSSGSSSDLRFVANFMLVPMAEYFGRSSDREVSYTMSEADERVLAMIAALRQGAAAFPRW